MALLTVQDGSAGLASVNLVPATGGGDTIPVGARVGGWDLMVVLVVRNADAASKTVTVAGVPFVVPATTGLAIIPVFAATGYLVATKAITYSAVTNLSVAAVRLSPAP